MSAAMSAADRPETGSPEWHSFHHAGEGQHHECDYDVCVEWSARQAPTPRPAMTVATLRKTTDGDTSARWRSQDADATSTRQAAVAALVSRAAEGVTR